MSFKGRGVSMLTPFKGNLYGTQCAMHQSTSEYLLACGLRAGMEFGVGWCGSPLRQTSHSTSGKKNLTSQVSCVGDSVFQGRPED